MLQSRLVSQGHQGPIYAVDINQSWIYTTAGDRFIARWNVATGEQDKFSIQLEKPAYCITFFNQFLFAGCTNGAVICIDVESKKLLWETNLFGHSIFSLIYHEQSKLLFVGDGESNLYALGETGVKKVAFNLAAGKIRSLTVAANQLFAGCQDGKIRVFDCETLNEIADIVAHKGSVNALLYIEVANQLYSGGTDGHISIIDCTNYQRVKTIPAHYQTVYDLKLFNDKLLSSSLDKSIKIWSMEPLTVDQKLTVQQKGHSKSVNKLAMINDHSFVSVGDDKRLIFWDLKTI